MFLTKVRLDLRHPSVRQALRDSNDMHRNLMSAFHLQDGKTLERAAHSVLYRQFNTDTEITLLMSSDERPDEIALRGKGFYTDASMIKDVSTVTESLKAGRRLKFDVLVSPCKKVSGEFKNSKRVFLRSEEERKQWLARKAEQNGFSIIAANEMSVPLQITGSKAKSQIHYSAVRYTGILQITDEESFRKAYCHGIGCGKAYGLGMLLLAACHE